MKKIVLFLAILSIAFVSCNGPSKDVTIRKVEVVTVVKKEATVAQTAGRDTVMVIGVSPLNENVGVLDQQHVFTGKQIVLSSNEVVETFLTKGDNVSVHTFYFVEQF